MTSNLSFPFYLNSTVLHFKARFTFNDHRTFVVKLFRDFPMLVTVCERDVNLTSLACYCLVCKLTNPACWFDQHKGSMVLPAALGKI